MPPNTPIFLLGLAVGTCLLIIGLVMGFWFGRKSLPSASVVDRKQFLEFLRELSQWTSEFSGDVSNFQSQLSSISAEVAENPAAPKEEIVNLLTKIMHANQQLQARLDSAEEKLEGQTEQISNYLTEARTDALTGLSNRRAFDDELRKLFEQFQKQGEPFSMGIIDVDHFKKINDTYGHPGGDAVLQQIASRIKGELHEVRCVARFGGEEFAVLSKTPAHSVSRKLDLLRDNVEHLDLRHEGRTIGVTMSGGTAEIQLDDSLEALVRRADEALYAAKLAGRNRVYEHDGMICRCVTPETARDVASTAPAVTEADREMDALQFRVQERFKRIVEEESRRAFER